MAHPGGRPRKSVDLVELEKLCGLQCTQQEIAAWFKVSISTVEMWGRTKDKREVMDRGYALGRISVRRKQLQLLEQGSNTMAVWLGKQLLGQRDNIDTTIAGPNGTPIAIEISPRELLLARIAGIAARGSADSGAVGTYRPTDTDD